MKTKALVLLSLFAVALAAPACVVTAAPPRDVGTVSADGSVFLGWHLLSRDNKTGADDQETYAVGAQLGTFSALRLHADKPLGLAQVLVIFADGERWVLPAPHGLGADEWTQAIPLHGGPRAIHSIVVTGQPTTSLLSKLEFHGHR